MRLHFKGTVFSGKGEGTRFIELPWVKSQIAEKLGFVPYPGTLNIKLTKDKVSLKKMLEKAKAIEISSAQGFCRGKCFKACFLDNLNCAVIIPKIKNYPEDILEVVASVNLRKSFQLKDGSVVKVKILF